MSTYDIISERTFLRTASPNEQRTISREDVGFYHAIVVGAVYEFEDAADVHAPQSFFGPLHHCINEHPFLSVVTQDTHTDKAYYQRVTTIDLQSHIRIVIPPADEESFPSIEKIIASNLDKPFPQNTPPWRLLVLPLERGCFIAFAYSHTIGDGPTGSAFHHSFLEACRNTSNVSNERRVECSAKSFPAPFDTPQRLPISWSFLLRPLLNVLLPAFISKLFGTNNSISSADNGTWIGSKMSYDPENSHSKIKLRRIEASQLRNALRIARMHDAKFTGMFQELVARALSEAILDNNVTNFVSQTTVNMRNSVGIDLNEGGNCFSACYVTHPRRHPSDQFSEENWKAAKISTQKLAESASTLQNQAIGLLRFAPSIRKWTLGKMGQKRDCSFEISNLGVFDEELTDVLNGAQVRITQMIFAQPGQVIGPPLEFNMVSLKGGDFMYTVTWHAGALGVGEDREDAFVEAVCHSIDKEFHNLAQG